MQRVTNFVYLVVVGVVIFVIGTFAEDPIRNHL